jgi:thiosulfate/3-mercaptopyruvate sulfurtransferase
VNGTDPARHDLPSELSPSDLSPSDPTPSDPIPSDLTRWVLPQLVSPGWLAARLHWQELVVLDATVTVTRPDGGPPSLSCGAPGYLTGHVPGAVFADLLGPLCDPQASGRFPLPSVDRFAAAAGELGIGPGRRAVVYDRGSGAWATRLWWQLRAFGFDQVAVLDGGLRAWQAAAQPTESGEVVACRIAFSGDRRPELHADEAAVRAAARLERPCLLFADEESICPRDGRCSDAGTTPIPGNRLLPTSTLLDPRTGRFLPVDQLRDRLEAAGVLAAQRPIAWSGAGIAAAVVAFAAALVGRPDVAVHLGPPGNSQVGEQPRQLAGGPPAAQ